ncbi:MAG: hypothetical protein RLN76_13700 [Phycisphaeraceae bacterium]
MKPLIFCGLVMCVGSVAVAQDLAPHLDIGVRPDGQLAVGFDGVVRGEPIVIDTFSEFLPGGGSGHINLVFSATQDIAFRTATTGLAEGYGFLSFSAFGVSHPQVALEAVSLDAMFEAFAFGQPLLDGVGERLVLNTPGNGLDFHPTYILRTGDEGFVGRVEGLFSLVPLTQTDLLSGSAVFPIVFVVGGDYDDDYRLTASDVDALAAGVGGSYDVAFDLDRDGELGPEDVAVWLDELAQIARGDANFDGRVDLIDLSVLASGFGGPGGWAMGDFSGDGVVDLVDLSLLASGFGETSENAVVPEPIGMLGGILGVLMVRRMRP